MSPFSLHQTVLTFLASRPRGETFTPTQLLAEVFPDQDWSRRTRETTTTFRALRKLGVGALAPYVTHPSTFKMGGKECRTYIWHTRPLKEETNSTALAPPISAAPNPGLTEILDTLARIERKIDALRPESS